MNFEKGMSNYGFSLKLNNLDRFTVYPSDFGGGTDIERDGNTNVKIGSSANNTNIFLYGIVFPRLLQNRRFRTKRIIQKKEQLIVSKSVNNMFNDRE